MGTGKRPTGITVLAILFGLAGLLSLIGAIGSIAGLGLGSSIFTMGGIPGGAALLGALGIVFGGISLVIAILQFAIAYGFWMGLKWSWWLALIVLIVEGLVGLLTIIAPIVAVIVIYYLTRPNVKKWFGA